MGNILRSDETSVNIALHIASEMKKNDLPKCKINYNSIK
jgi:hypothetical protein